MVEAFQWVMVITLAGAVTVLWFICIGLAKRIDKMHERIETLSLDVDASTRCLISLTRIAEKGRITSVQ